MKKLTYIFILSLFLTSCVEEIQPLVNEEYQSELVINSVVVPGDEYVEFFLSTSVPIDSDLLPFHPVDGEAEVRLFDQNGEVIVNYIPTDGVWRTSRTYQPKPGFTFELDVELTDNNVKPVSSSTFVPHPVNFVAFENSKVEQVENAGKISFEYTLDFQIESSEEDIHFRFIAKNPDTGLAIPIGTVLNGQTSVSRLNHMDGVLINRNIGESNISLVLESDIDLNNAEIHLYTVNSEYFRYNASLSDAYASHNSPFDEPVIRYSNIENGLGLFGSFTRSIKIYDLK